MTLIDTFANYDARNWDIHRSTSTVISHVGLASSCACVTDFASPRRTPILMQLICSVVSPVSTCACVRLSMLLHPLGQGYPPSRGTRGLCRAALSGSLRKNICMHADRKSQEGIVGMVVDMHECRNCDVSRRVPANVMLSRPVSHCTSSFPVDVSR